MNRQSSQTQADHPPSNTIRVFTKLLCTTTASSISLLRPVIDTTPYFELHVLVVVNIIPLGTLSDPSTNSDSASSSSTDALENTGSIKKRTNLTSAKKSPLSTSSADVSKSDTIAALKLKLLSAVSGLNRGLTTSEDDLRRADVAAKELENAGGPVDLITEFDKLQWIWKLVYSCAFSGRTLGGSRPGPPTGRLHPITLGQFGYCKP